MSKPRFDTPCLLLTFHFHFIVCAGLFREFHGWYHHCKIRYLCFWIPPGNCCSFLLLTHASVSNRWTGTNEKEIYSILFISHQFLPSELNSRQLFTTLTTRVIQFHKTHLFYCRAPLNILQCLCWTSLVMIFLMMCVLVALCTYTSNKWRRQDPKVHSRTARYALIVSQIISIMKSW